MTSAGMESREAWQATRAHRASRYFCAGCGREFSDPHALYEHMDKGHESEDKDGDGDS